ncbi:MAG TPA: RDD family protein [Luteimonas sp.]|nr:RDD family protein [Luteimonas sp.]
MSPAGFWRREAAWTLDAALVALPTLALTLPGTMAAGARAGVALDALTGQLAQRLMEGVASGDPPVLLALAWLQAPGMRVAMADLDSAAWAAVLPPLAVFAALWLVWSLAFECSSWQATPGKRALGLQVVDSHGRPLRPGRSLLRHLCGTLSWLTLNIGHGLAALPPAHRTLHDIASATRVECTAAPGPLPAWARAWVALQFAGLLAAHAWLLASLQARLLETIGAVA